MSARGHQDFLAKDIDWMDGSGDGIRYARFRMDEANPHSPSIILSKFVAGTRVPPHTHDCNYMEYILEGSQTNGKTALGKGDVRLVKGGTGYGPIVVGPEGCTVLIVFEDGSRSNTETLPRKKVEAVG